MLKEYNKSYLVGRIGLVDYDIVEISNLHRQVLHTESSVGMSKVESAKKALQKYVNYRFF